MTEATIGDVLIALARLEQKSDAMMEKLDRLERATDNHVKKIADLETKIALLEQRQGPKIHWVTWAAGFVALTAFALELVGRLLSAG
jgi:septal ring factor EnvC (AmiA/AmiB activator)